MASAIIKQCFHCGVYLSKYLRFHERQLCFYIPLACCLLVFGVLGLYIRYRNQKYAASLPPSKWVLPETIRSEMINDAVRLQCYNFRMALFVAGSFFWLTAFCVMLMFVQTETRTHPPAFMSVVDALLIGRTAAILGGIWVAGWVYYAYHRLRVTWVAGPVIDDVPADILYYQIKKNGLLYNIIYLQSRENFWVLVPATSQDTYRFKDVKQMARENRQNEQYVEQLRANLIRYGAQEKKFRLLSPYLMWSVIIWLVTLAAILVM